MGATMTIRTNHTMGATLLGLAALVIGGCYTTPDSRGQARDLHDQLQAYREEQNKRVLAINKEYRAKFAELMDTLDDLTEAELQLGREADAQRISDQLIGDGGATLRGRFRGAFGDAIKEQRRRIADADLAVATVRENYAKAYSEAKLEMAKIDLAIKNVDQLSLDDDQLQQVKDALKFVRNIVKTVDDTRKAAEDRAEAKQ
jgi:hypothetical protein